MSAWQLLVHSDEETLAQCRAAMSSSSVAERGVSRPIAARNLKEAAGYLSDHDASSCNLVVLGAATPADHTTSVAATTREPTMAFIRNLKKGRPLLPLIVLSAVPDETLRGFLSAFDKTNWVAFTPAWRNELTSRILEMVLNEASVGDSVLELDIALVRSQFTYWRLQRKGRNPFETDGQLYLDDGLLDGLIQKSKKLEGQIDTRHWTRMLEDLSRDLDKLLFQDSPENRRFWRQFTMHRIQTGGIDRTRIRFTVNDDTHPVLVEALRDEDESKDFWMLRAPIFRRYLTEGRGYPLFKDKGSREGSINCLVIEADSDEGELAGRMFPKLDGVKAEAREVRKLLESKKGVEHGIGHVRHLSIGRLKGGGDKIIQAFYRALGERPWHLIHFAGHVAKFSIEELKGNDQDEGETGVGEGVSAMVLSAKRRCAIDIANIVNKMPKTQFLFLSCCQSADSYVVMRAAEQYLPAVLGYRWTVTDEGATRFARAFYYELFDTSDRSYKYLEYAFRDARKTLYDVDLNDPTWASPVLVMQLKHAEAA